MKVVEHHRTGKVHLTEDTQDVGTYTLCGIELPTSPGRIMGEGEVCDNCKRVMC